MSKCWVLMKKTSYIVDNNFYATFNAPIAVYLDKTIAERGALNSSHWLEEVDLDCRCPAPSVKGHRVFNGGICSNPEGPEGGYCPDCLP